MPDEPGSILDALDERERTRVLSIARRRKFKRGEVIFHEGDPGDALHMIEKGHVAVRITTPLGDVATLTILGPGDAFGEGALLAPDSRRTATAAAVESAETRSIGAAEFERLRNEQVAVERFLTEALAAQVRRLSAHLLEALYVPAESRVLRRLVDLARAYGGGGGGGGGGGIVIPITQDDLATMAGTARPTANRVLKQAEARGVLVLSRGRVTVADLDGLVRDSR